MTRTAKTLIACALALAASLALAACTPDTTLDGTSWRLTEWPVDSIAPAQVTITARFADGRISGSGGVNSYGGPYTRGPGDTFKVGALTSTLMAGADPAMRAETAYFQMLGKAATCGVEGGKLTLFDAGGNVLLVFSATR